MAKTMYRGFSTIGRDKKFRLTDFDLVKQDVTNHFYIRKGEKLMNPNFGTIIWNVLHEPLTEDLKRVIITDIQNIAKYDPRVSFENVLVSEYDQGIQIELDLRYLQTNQSNTMNLLFDGRTNSLSVL